MLGDAGPERGRGTDLHLGVHVVHLLAGAPPRTLGGPRAGRPAPQEGEPGRDAGEHGPTSICLSLSNRREHSA
jgi:hypothetical protein